LALANCEPAMHSQLHDSLDFHGICTEGGREVRVEEEKENIPDQAWHRAIFNMSVKGGEGISYPFSHADTRILVPFAK